MTAKQLTFFDLYLDLYNTFISVEKPVKERFEKAYEILKGLDEDAGFNILLKILDCWYIFEEISAKTPKQLAALPEEEAKIIIKDLFKAYDNIKQIEKLFEQIENEDVIRTLSEQIVKLESRYLHTVYRVVRFFFRNTIGLGWVSSAETYWQHSEI